MPRSADRAIFDNRNSNARRVIKAFRLSCFRSGSAYNYGHTHNARGRLATVHQDGNLKGTYQYNSLEQLALRVVTNSGPFNGNILAEADGTTGVVSREYIWLPWNLARSATQ